MLRAAYMTTTSQAYIETGSGVCTVVQRIKALICSAGIPYGHGLKTWLLLF